MNRHAAVRAALCSCAFAALFASAQSQDATPSPTTPAPDATQPATPPPATPTDATAPVPVAAPEPYKFFCVRSSWDAWYGSWAWWVYATTAGDKYPHPPVWKWLENTKANAEEALSDDACSGVPMPPKPGA